MDNPTNAKFVADYRAYAKAHNLPNASTVVTNDPMEATYVGLHMWAQAVEKAGTTDVDKVRAAMAGQTFKAPDGFTLTMDKTNHHLHKPVMIGEVERTASSTWCGRPNSRYAPSRGARTSPGMIRSRTIR